MEYSIAAKHIKTEVENLVEAWGIRPVLEIIRRRLEQYAVDLEKEPNHNGANDPIVKSYRKGARLLMAVEALTD
jgi:hypothetical protein